MLLSTDATELVRDPVQTMEAAFQVASYPHAGSQQMLQNVVHSMREALTG